MKRNQSLKIIAICSASLAPGLSAEATELFDGRVKIDGYLMETFQSLEADSGAFIAQNGDTSSGFQRLRFNLSFNIDIAEGITGFVDLGEEPNDFGQTFDISQDLGFIDLNLPVLLDSDWSVNNDLILRAGNIVATTFNFRGYSDGAAVQGNPLIGNSPFDMVTAESGLQLLGSHQLDSVVDAVAWDVSLTVPTFFEDFGPDRGYDVTAKGSIDVTPEFSIGAGFFYSDNGGQVGKRPFGSIQTSAIVIGDGDNYNFPGSGSGARDTHSGLIPGLDTTIYHFDVQYTPSFIPFTFRGWYGRVMDDFSFIDGAGNQTVLSRAVNFAPIESEIQAFGVEGTYYIFPKKFYVAGRYSRVTNESDNVTGDDALERFQLGAGYWFREVALLKVEYVHQTEGDASPGQIGADWDGVLAELSVTF